MQPAVSLLLGKKKKKYAYNFKLYCVFRKQAVGCWSDPCYRRCAKLTRDRSRAVCLCFQLLKPSGTACLGKGGGMLELHEFLFFSKRFLMQVGVSVLILDLHCFAEDRFMYNSRAVVVCTSLPASSFPLKVWKISYPAKHLPYSAQCLPPRHLAQLVASPEVSLCMKAGENVVLSEIDSLQEGGGGWERGSFILAA